MIIEIFYRELLNLLLQGISNVVHGLLDRIGQKERCDQLRHCFYEIKYKQNTHKPKQDRKLDVGARYAFEDICAVTGKLGCDLSLHHRIESKRQICHYHHEQCDRQFEAIWTDKYKQFMDAFAKCQFLFMHKSIPPHSAEKLRFHNKSDRIPVIPDGSQYRRSVLHPVQ